MLTKKSYDYIIIGAGTSGCIIASRLLQNTCATVLLLEAGIPNHDPLYHISPQYPNALENLFPATIQAGTLIPLLSKEKNGRRIYGKVGCIWGGSSTVNGSVFNLPCEVDFQNWASYSGLPASLFANISQDVNSNVLQSSLSTEDVICKDLIEACNKCNIQFIEENDLSKREGVTWAKFIHRTDYSRFSTADLLQPFLSDPRLTIVSKCVVNKVNFNGSCAKSVECSIRGKKKTFKANKAIVCSAGTFASPLILQNSGIGPKGPLFDLPGVGKNLRDHLGLILKYVVPDQRVVNRRAPLVTTHPKGELSEALSKFLSGEPYIPPGGLLLYLKSFAHLDYPDVYARIICEETQFMIQPVILSPFSSGTVSQDSHCYNAFCHPFDILRMRRAVRLIDKIVTNFRDNTFSGVTSHLTDLQLDKFIRTHSFSFAHPVGTCAMGYSTQQGVVDQQLHVHHVDRLFVADCSILPQGVHGGTFAAAMCVGEYAAKSILGELDELQQQTLPTPRPSLWQIAGCLNLCSRVAIGLSHLKKTPQDFALLDHAVAAGCTTFDCAVLYPGTLPFGAWLQAQSLEKRSLLFVIGKGAHPAGNFLISRVNRKCIFEDVQYLLKALGTSYLDCFMLHRDDPSVPIEIIVQWLNEVVNAGLAKSYGMSNMSLKRIQEANSYAFSKGLLPIGLVSNYCGPLQWTQPPWPGCVQMSPEEARIVADDWGVPILSWSPISPILAASKNQQRPKDLQNNESDLVTSAIKSIFDISPKVGVIVRTTSLIHLDQIVAIE